MFPATRHCGSAPDDASRLRAAQQLVAAEDHQVGPGGECIGHPRLAPESPGGEVGQQPAAHIYQVGHSGFAAERGEIGRIRGRDESPLLEVGAMDREHRGDTGIERLAVVV
jgi:hypothetical protein